MYTRNEPHIFFPVALVRVCKHIKLCSYIPKVLFPVSWKAAFKDLNLLCAVSSWRENRNHKKSLTNLQIEVDTGIL